MSESVKIYGGQNIAQDAMLITAGTFIVTSQLHTDQDKLKFFDCVNEDTGLRYSPWIITTSGIVHRGLLPSRRKLRSTEEQTLSLVCIWDLVILTTCVCVKEISETFPAR